MKFIKRFLILFLVLLLVFGTGIFAYLHYQKPNYSGIEKVDGLLQKAEITYDNFGIPHIYAQNEPDAYFALGYAHAQDRLFQMELVRRLADGRLSEIFGKAALESDRFFRTLGFRKYAEKTIKANYADKNAPHIKAAYAYVAGINSFIKNGVTPIDFTLASIPKLDFTVTDSQIIAAYMGFTFAQAFESEPLCTMIYQKYGFNYLKDLELDWPKNSPKIPVGEHNFVGDSTLIAMASFSHKIENDAFYPAFHGSNGWLLAPNKTKSKSAILSNDTHIAFSQPSVWYEAHLSYPGQNFYGNFLAGVPSAPLGHNDDGGWGVTMFENDDIDFYREKCNPKNKEEFYENCAYKGGEAYDEIIKVKGEKDDKLRVRKSKHGVIINDIVPALKNDTSAIALWWTMYQFPDKSLKAFYDLSHAKNVEDAQKAVSLIHAPGLNIMWGDKLGNIGWWAAAKIPIRSKYVGSKLIIDGTSQIYDNTGWLDFSQNPQNVNPKSGILYTANNQPDDMGTGMVEGYYVSGDRAQRIHDQLFTNKNDWTTADIRILINDNTSATYPKWLKIILPLIKTKNTKELQKLVNWNGSHRLEDVEPTIFYKFLYRIYEKTFRDELGNKAFKIFLDSQTLKRTIGNLLANSSSVWWDNLKTKNKETRTEIINSAFEDAVIDLQKQLGNDINKWDWKNVHSIKHKHPLEIAPYIGKFFSVGPFAVDGGKEVINNLDFPLDSTGLYQVSYGPALRRIIDFSKPNEATSINPTGQSGNVMSPYYKDQTEMFNQGIARPEWTQRTDIEKNMIGKLVLEPNNIQK